MRFIDVPRFALVLVQQGFCSCPSLSLQRSMACLNDERCFRLLIVVAYLVKVMVMVMVVIRLVDSSPLWGYEHWQKYYCAAGDLVVICRSLRGVD